MYSMSGCKDDEKSEVYVKWPSMKQGIENFIRNCDMCQRNKATPL